MTTAISINVKPFTLVGRMSETSSVSDGGDQLIRALDLHDRIGTAAITIGVDLIDGTDAIGSGAHIGYVESRGIVITA